MGGLGATPVTAGGSLTAGAEVDEGGGDDDDEGTVARATLAAGVAAFEGATAMPLVHAAAHSQRPLKSQAEVMLIPAIDRCDGTRQLLEGA